MNTLNDTTAPPEALDLGTATPEYNAGVTAKVNTLLRWTGAILIILSALNFMLQGTIDITPAYRYWIAMAFTLLLCCGGLTCAYVFKETKGARIFFGLGMAFLSVQVSQVAAMIYAYWHGNKALQPEYAWLQFMDVSPTVIVLDFIVTAFMLLMVGYASFAILARNHLKTLIYASLLGNALLLIPVRDADWVPVTIAVLFICLRHIEQKLHQDSSMRLLEGIAARGIIALPLIILMGRSLLHPTSELMMVVLSLMTAAYFIYDIKRYTQSQPLLYIGQWLGTCAAIFSWWIIAHELPAFLNSNELIVLYPIVLIIVLLSNHVQYHAVLYRIAASFLSVHLVYSGLFNDLAMAPVIAIAIGVLLMIAGLNYKEKMPFFSGITAIIGGVLFYFQYVLEVYSAAPWISSIILGLLIIILASYLESKEKKFMQQSKFYINELKAWR